MFKKLLSFLSQVRIEVKRVNWPSRSQSFRITMAVVGISILVAAALGFFDFIFAMILQRFIL